MITKVLLAVCLWAAVAGDLQPVFPPPSYQPGGPLPLAQADESLYLAHDQIPSEPEEPEEPAAPAPYQQTEEPSPYRPEPAPYQPPAPAPYQPPAPYHPAPYHPAPAPHYSQDPVYPDAPPKYEYSYGVSDEHYGPNFQHGENRDGYKTEGSYTVDLPDGRRQIFQYIDNGDGLEAVVTYEGEAKYPEPLYPPTYN